MNLVSVLANELELSIPAAMNTAVELYNGELASFESEMEALSSIGRSVLNYVQGLEDWVHGHLAWVGLSGRYT